MVRSSLAAMLLVALGALGCVPDIDLSDRRCPCAPGWSCDEARDVCVPTEAASPVDDGGRTDAGPAVAGCADGVARGESCYRVYPATVDYGDARELCQLWSGDVLVLEDAEEDAWVRATLAPTRDFWLGLTDEETEGEFRDHRGNRPAYHNWDADEPNGGNSSDCVRLHVETGRWRDSRCRDEYEIVCERGLRATEDD